MTALSTDTVLLQAIECELIRFAHHMGVDPRVLRQTTETQIEHLGRELAYGLFYTVYGRRAPVQIVEYPATWIDAFKLHFFPRWGRVGRWLARRCPHRMARVEIKAYALFPELQGSGLRTQIRYFAERVEPWR